ncbi:C39 family peptidase [Paenibacillus sp. RC67]|uniref:C39 family peptidase n=1 Tax=Paenibacillus sp. RC67 TaxID=3039392 RepID=UPI0024ADEC92|nr:C39 family peptidase [Paenibacillus sp. RC67]
MTIARSLCMGFLYIGLMLYPEDNHHELFTTIDALKSTVIETTDELSYVSEDDAPRNEEQIIEEHLIDVEGLSQLPVYYNGCEITSLAMLIDHVKLPYTREDLVNMLPMDETPLIVGERGDIEQWGDPNRGFVGDIMGNDMGYGVYNKPIEELLHQIDAEGVLNLTGGEFAAVEKQIAQDRPVIVWTTSNFEPSESWTEWHSQNGSIIEATFDEHAVLMVGYDQDYVYVNNPLNGEKAEKVAKQPFIESWEQLGKQAITISK